MSYSDPRPGPDDCQSCGTCWCDGGGAPYKYSEGWPFGGSVYIISGISFE